MKKDKLMVGLVDTRQTGKRKPGHTTTRYLKNRDNPTNPTDHDAKTGEYYDFRKLVEIASREEIERQSPGSGYRLSKSKDKTTKQTKVYLEGKSSKVLEQFEEQWLFSKGYIDENGQVIKEKLKTLIEKDEAQIQRLLDEEKNSRLGLRSPTKVA